MNARVLVDGRSDACVSAFDRGLLYGDGLFETIRFVRGVAPLWARHMQRLHAGCARIALPEPDATRFAAEAQQTIVGMDDAVVRITLTRGIGERGYAPPREAEVTRIVAAYPLPAIEPDWYAHGIRVRSCRLRLAPQPRLAGLKHLNRLEQVLARAEWTDADVVEGLLFGHSGELIGATAANVFVALGGVPVTPALDTCGVAGVLRAELIDSLPRVVVRTIAKEELMRAEEVFLSSSVRGVLPVRELDGRKLPVGAHARAAQVSWRRLGFAETAT